MLLEESKLSCNTIVNQLNMDTYTEMVFCDDNDNIIYKNINDAFRLRWSASESFVIYLYNKRLHRNLLSIVALNFFEVLSTNTILLGIRHTSIFCYLFNNYTHAVDNDRFLVNHVCKRFTPGDENNFCFFL